MNKVGREGSVFLIPIVAVALMMVLNACGNTEADESQNREGEPVATTPADSFQVVDRTLAGMFLLMQEKRDSLPSTFSDTFALALEAILKEPWSATFPFDSLRAAGLRISESDDHRIRIYWWLHPWTGTMLSFPNIIQRRADSGECLTVYSERDQDEGGMAVFAYGEVYHLYGDEYLALASGRFWSRAPFEIASAFHFGEDGYGESDVEFRVADSAYSSVLVDKYAYLHSDTLEKYDRTMPTVMGFDPVARILSYPEVVWVESGEPFDNVLATEEVRPSGRIIRLQFNGRHFEPERP